MAYQVVESVMAHSKTKDTERLILMVIATHADAFTYQTTTGHETLASEANMHERTLIRHLKELEKTGELVIRRGSGRGNLTSYEIALPRWERVTEKGDNLEQRVTPAVTLSDEKRVTEKGDKNGERVTEPSIKGDKNELKGDKSACAYKDIEPRNHKNHGGENSAHEGFTPVESALLALMGWGLAPGQENTTQVRWASGELQGLGDCYGTAYRPTPERVAGFAKYARDTGFSRWGLRAVVNHWKRAVDWQLQGQRPHAPPSRTLSRDEQNRQAVEQATREFRAERAAKAAIVEGAIVE